MSLVENHPERNIIRVQLRQNCVLKHMAADALAELESHLVILDCHKGEPVARHRLKAGDQHAKEMILRFAAERDIETSYAAWRLKTPTPYGILCVTKARVAKLPLPQWVAFIDHHPDIKQVFEYEVMRLMSEIMAHTITLHLLDAPGRVHRFLRKHAELLERLPKKELASYLNMSAETLSRLKHQGKI